MTDATTQHAGTPPYDPLSQADARRILDASFQLMREIGVRFDADPRIMDLFNDAGCEVSQDGLVKFDPELVRDSLASTARRVRLWNRPGTEFIEIANGNTWFSPGMTCIQVVDMETGEPRRSTREDLADITRVADALPDIDFVCVPCKIVERSNLQGEIEEFAVMAANTTKPLEYLCESPLALEAAIEVAAAIRGGAERLAEKPYFLHAVTPLPLHYPKSHSDQILRAVEGGVPVTLGTATIGGASTPITIAGSMAHALATDFAGMTLAQLVRKGCFCVGSSDVHFMDPATGGIGGLSQSLLADMAVSQIRRLLDFPTLTGIGGAAPAGRGFDQDTLSQVTLTMMQTFHVRPATCDYLGFVDSGMTFSLHSLLFCHDLAGLLRRLWKGFHIDDETLALDVSRAVGPGGNYLAQRHTARHCRAERWASRYFKGGNAPGPEQPDLVDRIDRDLREILASHRPEPLPEALRSSIDTVLEKWAV